MDRRDTRAPAGAPEFKGVPINTFLGGKEVVLNIDGDWYTAVLVRDARVVDGKLELVVPDARGVHRTLQVDYVPETFNFSVGDTIADSKLGGDFHITRSSATTDGRVEYELQSPADPTTGRRDTLRHIPQEYLTLWNETLALETALGVAEVQIESLKSNKARVEVQKTFDEAEALMDQLFKTLPDPKKMSEAGHKAIATSKNSFEALRKKAEDAMDKLQRQVAGAKDAPHEKSFVEKIRLTDKERKAVEKHDKNAHEKNKKLAEMIKPGDETAAVEAAVKFDTDAHVATLTSEKEAHETAMRTADGLIAVLDKKAKTDFERLKFEVMDEKVREKEAVHALQKTQHDAEEAQVAAGIRAVVTTPDPGVFNVARAKRGINANEVEKEARLRARALHIPALLAGASPEVARAFDEVIAAHGKAEADAALLNPGTKVYVDTDAAKARFIDEVVAKLKKPYSEKDKKLSDAADKAARKRGKETYWNGILANPLYADLKTEVDKIRREHAKKEVNPALLTGATPPEYVPAEQERVNAEIAPQVLEEWKKDFVPKAEEALKEHEEWYDFDAQASKIKNAVADMIKAVTESGNGTTPKKGMEDVYRRLVLVRDSRIAPVLPTLESLTDARAAHVKVWDAAASTYLGRDVANESELTASRKKVLGDLALLVKMFKDELKDFDFKDETTLDAADRPIDLASSTVEKIFASRRTQLADAMKRMYRGGAASAFRDIMPTIKPASVSDSELHEAGITSWDSFKKRWDKELAAEVAGAMEAAAVQTLMRKVAERMNSMAGAWEKIKASKGQIAARVVGNAILMSGATLGLSELAAKTAEFFHLTGTETLIGSVTSSDVVQGTAKIGGGMLSGIAKWFTGNKVFNWGGKNSWNNSVAHDIEERKNKMRDSFIDTMVDESLDYAAVSSMNQYRTAGAPAKRGFFARLFGTRSGEEREAEQGLLEGGAMMASVLSETVRAKTATMSNHGLTGNARLLFERVLSHLDTKSPDAEKVRQLALAITEMQSRGTVAFESVMKQPAPAIDTFLKFYAGGGSLKEAMAANAALAGIFLVSGTARAAFGGFVGAVAGWRKGEAMYYAKERKNSRLEIMRRLGAVQRDTRNFTRLSSDEKQTLRSEVLYLKRFLHGTLPPEELSAGVYVVQGSSDPYIDELLLQQISSVLYEADKTGLHIENSADRAKLDKVLAAMQKVSSAANEREFEGITKRFGKWLERTGYKAVGAGIGGAVGGATSYYGGNAARWLAEKAGLSHAIDMTGGKPPTPRGGGLSQTMAGTGAGISRNIIMNGGPDMSQGVVSHADFNAFNGKSLDTLLLHSLNHLRGDIASAHGLNTTLAQDASTMAADMQKALTGHHTSIGGVRLPDDIHDIAEIVHGKLVVHDLARFNHELVEPFAEHARDIHAGIESHGAENLGNRKWGKYLDALDINEKSSVHNVGLGRAEIGAGSAPEAAPYAGFDRSSWNTSDMIVSGPDRAAYTMYSDGSGHTMYRRVSDQVLFDSDGNVIGKAIKGRGITPNSFAHLERIKADAVGKFSPVESAASASAAAPAEMSLVDKLTKEAKDFTDKLAAESDRLYKKDHETLLAWTRTDADVGMIKNKMHISEADMQTYVKDFETAHRDSFGNITSKENEDLRTEFVNGLAVKHAPIKMPAAAREALAGSSTQNAEAATAVDVTVPGLREATAQNPIRLQHDAKGGDWVRFFQDGKQHTVHLGSRAVDYSTALDEKKLMMKLPGSTESHVVKLETVEGKPIVIWRELAQSGQVNIHRYSINKQGLLKPIE